jgi:hypothetical protein
VQRGTGHSLVLFFYPAALDALGQSRYSVSSTRTDDDYHEAARTDDDYHEAARTDDDHHEAARTDDDHHEAARTDDDHHEAARTDDDHHAAARTDDDHHAAARTDDDDHAAAASHSFLFLAQSMVPSLRTSGVVRPVRMTRVSLTAIWQ